MMFLKIRNPFKKRAPKRRRPKIDRSMIGQPTNFQHTGHIGSTDVGSQLSTVQIQMNTKGGYGEAEGAPQPSMPTVPVRPIQDTR